MVHPRHLHAFWDWFVRHLSQLRGLATGDPTFGEFVAQQLQRVHRGFVFECGSTSEGTLHFIISADGRRDLFADVHRLVDAAPPLVGWRITALRPRRSLPLEMFVEGGRISTDDVWFSAEQRDGLVDLTIFFKDLTDHPLYLAATFVFLDAALGEYDVETKIGRIDCDRLPADPMEAGLLPFKELQELVDAMGVGVV